MTLETVLRNIELDDMVKVMVFHYNYNGDIFKTKLSYGKTTDTLHLLANSFFAYSGSLHDIARKRN